MIILASASAVRARLLSEAGVAFKVAPADFDEETVKARLVAVGANPRAIADRLAEAKAVAAPAADADLIIGADQTLELDGELVSKAGGIEEARDRLRRLRGRVHQLHTAAVLARGREVIWRATASPRLFMRNFSDAFLEDYLSQGGEAALTSVGCYHLEGRGAQLFDKIEGDYFAVLGLPLIELLTALRGHGALGE